MCTIAILIDIIADAPLVLAANRDELFARPTRGPSVFPTVTRRSSLHVVGGHDLASGGSWLAVRTDGQFAGVTNQRALASPSSPGARSRGLAVVELAAARDPDRYVAELDATRYASMNLVWRSGERIRVGYARTDKSAIEVHDLAPGIHVLCNDVIGSPLFPRAQRLERAIAPLVGARWHEAHPILAGALADHTLDDAGIAAHLPAEVSRALTATCIHTPHYGTRSATLVAIAGTRVLDYRYAEGPPCTTAFTSHCELFDD